MEDTGPFTQPKNKSTNSSPSKTTSNPSFGSWLMITRCGEIKRLVMGLDRFQKTPCGFCFVEYYTHQDALDCMKYIGGTKLDERVIRTDLDEGFIEGRQYG
jgi:RNA recognition motif. (a.k.a. RRM, RBD, or RNP domain)